MNNVYIVWSNEDNNGQVNVFFSVSTDNGQTFSTPIDVSNHIPFSFDSYICILLLIIIEKFLMPVILKSSKL